MGQRRGLAAASVALMLAVETHKRSIKAHKRALHECMDALAEIHSVAEAVSNIQERSTRGQHGSVTNIADKRSISTTSTRGGGGAA